MTLQGWSVDLKIGQTELQWGECRSIRENLMLATLKIAGTFLTLILTLTPNP